MPGKVSLHEVDNQGPGASPKQEDEKSTRILYSTRLGAPAVAYKRAPRPGRLPLPCSCPSSINQLTSRKLNQTSPAIHLRHGTPQLRYVGCCFVIQSNLKSIGPYEIDHSAPTSESDLQEDEDSAPRPAAGRRLPRNRRRPLSPLLAMAASWEDDRSYTASVKASHGAPATAWATGSSTSSPGHAPSKSAKLLLRRLRRRRRPSLTLVTSTTGPSQMYVYLHLDHSCQRTGSSESRNGIAERGSTCWRTRIGQGYTSLVRQFGSGIAIHFCLGR
jgi:hypothetical protein